MIRNAFTAFALLATLPFALTGCGSATEDGSFADDSAAWTSTCNTQTIGALAAKASVISGVGGYTTIANSAKTMTIKPGATASCDGPVYEVRDTALATPTGDVPGGYRFSVSLPIAANTKALCESTVLELTVFSSTSNLSTTLTGGGGTQSLSVSRRGTWWPATTTRAAGCDFSGQPAPTTTCSPTTGAVCPSPIDFFSIAIPQQLSYVNRLTVPSTTTTAPVVRSRATARALRNGVAIDAKLVFGVGN